MAQVSTNITSVSDEILEAIFSYLSFHDLTTVCQFVCKQWCQVLTGDCFWRLYISRFFDISPDKNAVNKIGYFRQYERYFKPSPLMLNCGVLIPADYNIQESVSSAPKQLARALYVLTKIKAGLDKRELVVDNGRGHPVVCLFPWKQEVLPSTHRIFKILNLTSIEYISSVSSHHITWQLTDEVCGEMFNFHVVDGYDLDDNGVEKYSDSSSEEDSDADDSDSSDTERKQTDKEGKPKTKKRLFESDEQRTLHLGHRPKGEDAQPHICECEHGPEENCNECDKFHVWVTRIFRPSIFICAGEETHSGGYNYTLLLTRLSPGFMGGVIALVNIGQHEYVNCTDSDCRDPDKESDESD